MKTIHKLRTIFFSSRKRAGISAVVILITILLVWRNFSSSSQKVTYQTEKVQRDTLVVSLSESGSVSVANRIPVTTQVSGTVSEVFVKSGEAVEKGQKIATLTLDAAGQQKEAASYASYLSAQSNLNKANADMFSTQSNMYSAWDKYINIAQNSTYQNPDGSPNISNRALPEFTTSQDDWMAAEANYKNQQTVVSQAQSSLTSAFLSYQQSSSEIDAPVSGVLSDLTIAPGMQIANTGNSSSSSSNTSSSTNVASIKAEGNPIVVVNLSETDATKITSGQKATVSLDALPEITFTGKVLGVNTTGSVSSGVTTYPATIMLDSGNDKILPNMSATASIITHVKPNVLLVPNAAVQTTNGTSLVRVMKNGKVTSVPVEIGLTSDTQTEITSGLSEGDEVVVATIGTRTGASSSTSSPFGAVRGFGGGTGGGNFIRVGAGGGR